MTQTDIRYIQSEYAAPISAAVWQATAHTAGAEGFRRHTRVMDLFEAILRYTGAIMLGYYRQRIDNLADVESLLENVRRPFLGHWWELQRTLMETYKQCDDNPLVAALCQAFTESNRESQRVNAYGKFCELTGRQGERKSISYRDIAEQLVSYSNWLRQGPGQYLDQNERALHASCLETLLIKMLLDLDCLAQYPLAYTERITLDRDYNEHARLALCMGTSQDWRREEAKVQGDLSDKHCSLWHRREDGTLWPLLDLHPWVIYTHCKKEPRRKDQIFMLIEAGSETQGGATYVSYECGHVFNPERKDPQSLNDDLERVLNHDRWADYLAQRAMQRHGQYLTPYLNELKQKQDQTGYPEEHKRIEQILTDKEAFGFPQPVVERIFAQCGIGPPVRDALHIEAFVATPSSIGPGSTTVLVWDTQGAERVEIEPTIGEVKPSGQQQVSPSQTTTYTLHAHSAAGEVRSQSATIEVLLAPPPPTIDRFTVTPDHVEQGQAVVLEWRTQGAERVVIEPSIGPVEATGQQEASPAESTTYTLQVFNTAGESQSESVTVEVLQTPPPPTIGWFTATPDHVEQGQAVVLEWRTQGAEKVLLEPSIGPVEATGQREVSPAESTTYTLQVFNRVGESQEQRVHVEVFLAEPPPPPGSLVEVWQAYLPEPIVRLVSSPQTNYSLAVGEEGGLFFLGGDGQERWRSRAEVPLRAAIFTPDGHSAVTADWNGLVRCYQEDTANPLWEAHVQGVVSTLQTGHWRGQEGVFIGTWRQGLFFCDREGQVQSVAKTDATINALCVFPQHEGCAIGDWEGAVNFYKGTDEQPRPSLRQPVRALACLGSGDRVLALTTRDSFYALDEKGEVFWLYESPELVTSWAFAVDAGKCFYCTESGQHHEIRVTDEGQRHVVEARRLRNMEVEQHDSLATDAAGSYLVVHNQEGTVTLYAGETRCEQVPVSSPVSAFYFDPCGSALTIAAGQRVHAFVNQHKLAHARPAKLKVEE